MRTLVYLHGFRSSPQSAKAQCFVRAIGALPESRRPCLHVPALPPDPAGAVAGVASWIERELAAHAGTNMTLVGSSLGGFYATHLAERFGARAALINPAIRPWDDLRPYIGTQRNLHTGEAFEVTVAHHAALRALAVARITRPNRYFLLVRSGDELLPWNESVAFYAGARQYVKGGGDHGWTDFDDEVPAVLHFAGVADS
ncbi:MAG: YqiA/YcfP family alpha/beta fold hydrolase [Casimicrobiaceae bacterium]